jgi:hypothetical protein
MTGADRRAAKTYVHNPEKDPVRDGEPRVDLRSVGHSKHPHPS